MARITPQLNHTAGEVVGPTVLNRIENNNKQAFDEIDANEAQRDIDEAALQANIDAETAARIADVNAEETRAVAVENSIIADLGGIDFVNGNAGTQGKKTFSQNEVWVIPKGLYMCSGEGSVVLQIKTSEGWGGYINFRGGLILSDGINYRFTALNVASPGAFFYRKLS